MVNHFELLLRKSQKIFQPIYTKSNCNLSIHSPFNLHAPLLMAASSNSLETSVNSSFSIFSPFMTSSFSDLLNSSASDNHHSSNPASNTVVTRGFSNRIAERTGSAVPKFKSIQPPALPVSPPLFSPSSYFAIPPGLSPADLLDSPVLLSSSTILPSPTTGTFPAQTSHWNKNFRKDQQNDKLQSGNHDFTFQPQTRPSATSLIDTELFAFENRGVAVGRDEAWKSQETTKREDLSPEIASLQNCSQANYETFQHTSQATGNQKKSDDGYNWRKYGQKQVKGSENPRSYYKCTHPSCPTKKKVERSLDGHITEVIYKGTHNHPKPQSTRRSSAKSSQTIQLHHSSQMQDKSYATTQTDSVVTEASSISVTDNDFDQISQPERGVLARNDTDDEDEPETKRWKNESESVITSVPGSRAVREPRVVVQTISDIDILDDGFRWRKYGQKVVKGNPNPRSYYKCTTPGCPVRKHVERASQNLRAVVTTYEGKHNHEAPAARGGGSRQMSRLVPESGNDQMVVPMRPSAVAAHQNSSVTSSEHAHQISNRLPELQRQQPSSTLERLQNAGSFRNFDGYFPNPKEEPRHDLCP